ncbi:hypothetical protein FOE78_13805 [Microlunatus elymi]|uniref:Uncharacterized protein n=1 Tax=Microlunatus elymi TaxID=2596828 RepID=A0A516Q0D5_9ACTN|nr:hypothetical protein [Microlunatus elymi]QDP96842.1 hypothetical protein FOE78_13805 [Microlunatus elymi]
MPNILIRAHKSPFRIASAEESLEQNLLGRNAGNLIFSQSVCRLLSTRGTSERTVNLAGLERSFRPASAAEPIDRLVLPLANAFRPGYQDQLARMTKIIKRAAVPVTVLGVGAQGDAGRHPPPGRRDRSSSHRLRTGCPAARLRADRRTR